MFGCNSVGRPALMIASSELEFQMRVPTLDADYWRDSLIPLSRPETLCPNDRRAFLFGKKVPPVCLFLF